MKPQGESLDSQYEYEVSSKELLHEHQSVDSKVIRGNMSLGCQR
jgi:hypothetical protein